LSLGTGTGGIYRELLQKHNIWNYKVSARVMKSSLQRWFKAQNDRGKYIRVRSFWRQLKNLYEFHSRERFENWLRVWFKTLLGYWAPMELSRSIIRRRFYVMSKRIPGGVRIIKLPTGSNKFSCALILALKDQEKFEKYQQCLGSVKCDRWLRNHTVAVSEIFRNGGYESEFIQGINLAEMRDDLLRKPPPPRNLREDLIFALEELLDNLRGFYKEHEQLTGDWPLHNLVYSAERKAIINVDAEGFFTYEGIGTESDLTFVENNLRDMVQLLELIDERTSDDRMVLDVFRALDEVRASGEQYSGTIFVSGYHTLTLRGRRFRGQRECSERLKRIPFDFRNKVVIDLGCNVGGMLHAIAGSIKKGIGFDCNSNCVNAAHMIRRLNDTRNLEFYTFDLDGQDFSLLRALLCREEPDIIFLLSVCRWLKRWPELIREASCLADGLLFESNGSGKEQLEQLNVIRECYGDVRQISESSVDDVSLRDRKLFLCKRRQTAAHGDVALAQEVRCT
jgi:hypothetical protein